MKKFLILTIAVAAVLAMYGCGSESVTPPAATPLTISIARPATRTECPNSLGNATDLYYLSQIVDGQPADNALPISTAFKCETVVENVITADFSPCVQCHGGVAKTFIDSRHVKANEADATTGYLKDNVYCIGCHTNNKTINQQPYTLVGAKSGFSCEACHSKKGDFINNFRHSPTDAIVSASEPCWSCHGDITTHGAQGHFTPFSKNISGLVGKMYKTDDNTTSAHANANHLTGDCGLCHNGAMARAVVIDNNLRTSIKTGDNYTARGGAALNMYAGWKTSVAYKDTYTKVAARGEEGRGGVTCSTCHEQHGVDRQSLPTKDVVWTTTAADVANKSITVFSAEFMLCTSCHVVGVDAKQATPVMYGGQKYIGYEYTLSKEYVPAGPVTTTRTDLLQGAHGTSFAAPSAANRAISDTHFKGQIYSTYTAVANDKDNATFSGALLSVEGYGINAGAKNACTSCHDVHKGSMIRDSNVMTAYYSGSFSAQKITENWAKSKHNAATTVAFTRSNYSSTCNRCHNGRAAVYSFDGADRGKLNQMTFNVASTTGQAIGCATCHDLADNATVTRFSVPNYGIKNADVKVRNQYIGGDYTKPKDSINPEWVDAGLTTKTTDAAGTVVDLASLANAPLTRAAFGDNSLICVTCHAGRNTGERIVESVHANGTKYPIGTPTTSRAITDYVHYMDAAGTMTKTGPYMFTGKTYGVTTLAKHGEYGPALTCVSCHDVKGHTFKVYKDTAGDPISAETMKGGATAQLITSIASCTSSCHGSGEATLSAKAKKGFDAALVQLKAQLATKGKHFVDPSITVTGISYGTYWATAAGGATPVEAWTDLNELGAAYNVTYFSKYDTGAWAHGSNFAKQILWDSMQVLGGTFTGDAAAWIAVRP